MQDNSNKEIDLIDLTKELWANKYNVLKWAGFGIIFGFIVWLSIPNTYTSNAKMLAEENTNSMGTMAGSLASMMGVGNNNTTDGRSLPSSLYPEIVKTTPFLMEFCDIKVDFEDKTIPLWKYITNKQDKSWFTHLTSTPSYLITWISKMGKETVDTLTPHNSISWRNTYKYYINQAIKMENAEDNNIISLNVTTQDPKISNTLVDSILLHLQEYATQYKTRKTSQLIESLLLMQENAKNKYYVADNNYAEIMDRNTNLLSNRSKIKLERLKDERDIAFSVYQQLTTQVESQLTKLMEETPIFTVIEPSYEVTGPTAPNRFVLMIIMGILSAFGYSVITILKSIVK